MSGAALSKANGASVIGEEEIVLLPTVTDVYRRLQAAPECSIPAEARVVDEDEVVSLLGVPLLVTREQAFDGLAARVVGVAERGLPPLCRRQQCQTVSNTTEQQATTPRMGDGASY